MNDVIDMCRLCLEKGRAMQPIFKSESLCLVKLIDVLQLETAEGDGLPAQMCHQCAFKLDAAYVFKKRCHDNYHKLRDICQQMSSAGQSTARSETNARAAAASDASDESTSSDDEDNLPLSKIPVECLYKDDNSDTKRRKTDKSHACSVCKKTFLLAIQLKAHVRTHKLLNKCLVCYETFSNQGKFRVHLRGHVGSPAQCGVCDKVFLNENYLEHHVKTHVTAAVGGGEIAVKPFHCGLCDKSFVKQAHLVEHERCHSGERPFSCGVCDKKFTTKCNLRRHGRVHS